MPGAGKSQAIENVGAGVADAGPDAVGAGEKRECDGFGREPVCARVGVSRTVNHAATCPMGGMSPGQSGEG